MGIAAANLNIEVLLFLHSKCEMQISELLEFLNSLILPNNICVTFIYLII